MTNRTKRTPKKIELFLQALAEGKSVRAACESAVIARTTAYEWRESDPDFRMAWEAAVEAGTDKLEDEAARRALDSSDTLMIFLLKARRPDKYKDRHVQEVTGKDGEPLAPVLNVTIGGTESTPAQATGHSAPDDSD